MTFPPLNDRSTRRCRRFEFFWTACFALSEHCRGEFALVYGVLGFAVLHAITQGMSARPFVLSITYVRRNSARLADACSLSARAGRNGDRIARSRIRQRGPPTHSST